MTGKIILQNYQTDPKCFLKDEFDIPITACTIAHEFGHYLLGENHNNSINNLMKPNDIQSFNTVMESVSSGRSDLFELTLEQIQIARERAEWIIQNIKK